jgi:hypothetical protein
MKNAMKNFYRTSVECIKPFGRIITVSATTATTGSPCQQARSIANACWGADFIPTR